MNVERHRRYHPGPYVAATGLVALEPLVGAQPGQTCHKHQGIWGTYLQDMTPSPMDVDVKPYSQGDHTITFVQFSKTVFLIVLHSLPYNISFLFYFEKRTIFSFNV